MRKIFILTSLILLCFSIGLQAQEVEYHFQEGFESTKPSGWTRTCAATTSLVHVTEPPLSFAGAGAIKFDQTCVDETFYLETPTYPNAGTLSFYATRNANNVLMDLHIVKIVNGVSTEIKTIDVNTTISHKNNGWTQISIPVNETQSVKFRFYVTIKDGNAAWFSLDDMELTKYTENTDPPGTAIEKVSTDFADGTWGTPLDKAPSSGAYPAEPTEVNGYTLEKAVLVTGSMSCPSGIKHTNRIYMDKMTNGGAIVFPLLKDVGEVELHVNAGTEGNTFRLDEEINGNWSTIGIYAARKTPDSIHTITINRNVETKLRVANNSGGAIVVYKIVTRTYKESMDLNVIGTTPEEGTTCYYNLTNTVTLTFNKEVDYGTGNILLKDMEIPVSSCIIDGKTVTVPVTLESNPSGIVYSMTIPAGAFVEKEDPSNLSNEKIFSFQTFKTVSYPTAYSSQIDVLYSTADPNQNRMDIYYPTSSEEPVPVVINIHGGGWNHGEKESQSGFNVYFNMGFAVANIEYRMTPQALAPAAIVDTRAAMLYLIDHAEELNIDPSKIIFQGGSAGGHLALTAGYLQNDSRFDYGYTPKARKGSAIGDYEIIAVIDKYGPSHLEDFMFYSSLVNWLGDKKDDTDFVKSISPALMVTADTPPTYIVHGDADPTVPYSQSVTLADALAAAGVKHQFTTVPGGLHGGFPAEYNTQMNEEITAFLKDILDNVLSIDSEKADENISISLNGNTLEINAEGASKTEIFDIAGRKLVSTSNKAIEMPQHSTGVLVVKVTTEAGIYVKKILK